MQHVIDHNSERMVFDARRTVAVKLTEKKFHNETVKRRSSVIWTSFVRSEGEREKSKTTRLLRETVYSIRAK